MRKEPSDILKGKENNCALVAAWNVLSTLTEEQIIAAAMVNDYSEEAGIKTYKFRDFCRSLRIKIKEVEEVKRAWRDESAYTVNQVRKKYNDGIYFCYVKGHIFVLNHGDIVDPNWDNYGVRREVIYLYRVMNSDGHPFAKTISLDDRLTFKVDIKLATRKGYLIREKLELIQEVFGTDFSAREVRAIMTLREIEALLKRGVLKKI